MNRYTIPEGPTETIQNGNITNKPMLLVEAETDLTISDITYEWQPSEVTEGRIANFTLKAGRHLFHVKSIVFTGIATITYSGVNV